MLLVVVAVSMVVVMALLLHFIQKFKLYGTALRCLRPVNNQSNWIGGELVFCCSSSSCCYNIDTYLFIIIGTSICLFVLFVFVLLLTVF